MTFDDKPHIRMASLGDLWKRTVTVGSAGKSFSATGWRIGWLTGPANLIRPTLAASTRIVFCANHPAQEATAVGLEKAAEEKFFEIQREEYEERRGVFMEGLDKLGLPYTIPEGGYFVMVNTESLIIPEDFVVPEMIAGRARDWVVSWFIAQTAVRFQSFSSPLESTTDDWIDRASSPSRLPTSTANLPGRSERISFDSPSARICKRFETRRRDCSSYDRLLKYRNDGMMIYIYDSSEYKMRCSTPSPTHSLRPHDDRISLVAYPVLTNGETATAFNRLCSEFDGFE